MKNIYLQLADEGAFERPRVLATVIRTSGSTPQKPGSSALFSENGIISGTVGGGIVEGRVQASAFEAYVSKRSALLNYDLYNDITDTEEAICGGQITVLLDADPAKSINVFRQLGESLKSRIPGVLITMVKGNNDSEVLIDRYWMSLSQVPEMPGESPGRIKDVVNQQIVSCNPHDFREIMMPGQKDEPATLCLLEPVVPPDHLVIAGAGHIGRALAHIGGLLGFEVTVVDDRPKYASKVNIPDADNVIVKDIGLAMQELKKSEDTFVVIVTRGHKDDAEALRPCIGSALAYTGMIGSRKKVAAMKEEFIEKGFATQQEWDKIFAPVGIDIGSQSVEEIAVSIAAQLVKVRNSIRQSVIGNR